MDPQTIAELLGPLSPEERAALLNQNLFGFDAAVGLRFRYVSGDRMRAELTVTDRHVQPYGLVHGGVYATLAESVCSVGAAFAVMADGKNAVGLENHTRFLRGTRAGVTLVVEAAPRFIKGADRIWAAEIRDDEGPCATAEVRLRVLEPGRSIAGQTISFKGGVGGK